jgi:hypothetical protein
MAISPLSPANFPHGSVFTTNWNQNVYYQRDSSHRDCPPVADISKVLPDGPDEGCYAPCTVKIKHVQSEIGVADLSAKLEIDGEEHVLIYRMKGPGEAMNISAICAAATLAIELPLSTVYYALRIPVSIVWFILATPVKLLTEDVDGWAIMDREWSKLGDRVSNSLWHIVSGPFFAIALAGAHVLIILESVLTGYVATDPLNMRKVAVRIMLAWNDYKPLQESWWSVAGPMKDFKWLTDEHHFVFPGCYHAMSVGVLNKAGTKVEKIRSFSGKDIAHVDDSIKQKQYNPCPCYYDTPKIE